MCTNTQTRTVHAFSPLSAHILNSHCAYCFCCFDCMAKETRPWWNPYSWQPLFSPVLLRFSQIWLYPSKLCPSDSLPFSWLLAASPLPSDIRRICIFSLYRLCLSCSSLSHACMHKHTQIHTEVVWSGKGLKLSLPCLHHSPSTTQTAHDRRAR